jgi:hypothetical protein
MTIKVTVTNSDSRKTAVISVRENGKNPPMQPDTQGQRTHLAGGETIEVWVHGTQYIVIEEVSQ